MRRRRCRCALLIPALLAAALVGGCGAATTETGYEPRRLGLSDAQRKGLYAAKYTPEQAQAQAEREAEARRRAPGGREIMGP